MRNRAWRPLCPASRAGKNLRFLKKVFRFLRFLGFLGFNAYAPSHTEHWTQGHDHLKSYTRRLTHALVERYKSNEFIEFDMKK